MDINRTDSRKTHLEDPAQKAERTTARFKSPASQPVDPGAAAPPPGVPSGVTQADLRDAGKTEATMMRCFGDLVDNAGRQLGVAVSDAQRHNLVEFLGSDPIMRGKLRNYLDQIVK
jgi:hypothetical protein